MQLDWILGPDEPWTRCRTLLDVAGRSSDHVDVAEARSAMAASDPIRRLIGRAGEWPGYPLKRHNDAAQPLCAITTLADFGLSMDDPGIGRIAASVLEHFDGDQFETLVWLPRFLTKEDDDVER